MYVLLCTNELGDQSNRVINDSQKFTIKISPAESLRELVCNVQRIYAKLRNIASFEEVSGILCSKYNGPGSQ